MDFFRPAEDAERVIPSRRSAAAAQAGGKKRKNKTYRAKRRVVAKTRKHRR